MSALLLGGAGFIGLHLARRLVGEGHKIMIVDDFSRGRDDPEFGALRAHPYVTVRSADLTDAATWDALPHDFEQVFLLAAIVGVRNVVRDPVKVLRVNAQSALHLLNWATPRERIFFASTSEVYAGGVNAGVVPVPTDESVPVHVDDVASPRFTYAISKLLGEAAFLHGTAMGNLSAVVGRFHNVYGPRMGADHVIGEMVVRALGGEDPFLVPGADQYRSFCYVDDAVEAISRLMATPEVVGRIVHVGDDTAETNIADLAKLVLQACGVRPEIQTAPAPPGAVSRRLPDLTMLRQLTGYSPRVTLEDGVARTVEWCRSRR